MEENRKGKISRRDTIKALATIPFLGYFVNRFYVKYENEWSTMGSAHPDLGIADTSIQIPAAGYSAEGKKIRIGLVGNGFRGPQLLRAFGFAGQKWAEDKTDNGIPNSTVQGFLAQDDLNVEITGVCDTFSPRAEEAAEIV